jgi:hypothetical protein
MSRHVSFLPNWMPNPMVWQRRSKTYWTGRRREPGGAEVGVVLLHGWWVCATRRNFGWTAPVQRVLERDGLGGHVVGSLREVAHAAGDGVLYAYRSLEQAKRRAAEWAR